jgi:hypothetical protein
MDEAAIKRAAAAYNVSVDALTEAIARERAGLSVFSEDTRLIEIISTLLQNENQRLYAADFQFIGLHDGRAYFLRASRSEEEKDSEAFGKGLSALLALQENEAAPGQGMPPEFTAMMVELEGELDASG